ncbi:hypothetical protein [Enterovirga rhinocerotis]|uniref:hypothetical protein n=1 Tax=Enterovirga rhinocerotis TaxID=1339210 RepID=UPI00105F270F|nr:hypothetical protein [Enterovirga rhinocerotis]
MTAQSDETRDRPRQETGARRGGSKTTSDEKRATDEFFKVGIAKDWPITPQQRRMQGCGQ